MNKDFGPRLRLLREAIGWTQEELAKKSGLKQAAICHFERCRRLPSFQNLIRLSDALNCRADDFYPPKKA